MLEDVHARNMHRRLKARFSPTEIFTITPVPDSTTDSATQTANSITDTNTIAATSTPAVTDTPGTTSQASATSAQPATTSAAPATSSSTAATSSSTSSSSSTSTSSSTSSSSSSSSSSSPTSTAAAATNTQSQAGALGASVPAVTRSSTVSYQTASYASLAASASASATAAASNTTSSSSVSAPVIIGIVVAVIAGLAGIIFAVTFFMRRASRDDEGDILRRQSMVLPDDNSFGGHGNRGFAPPSSSMTEQYGNHRPISFSGQQYADQEYHGFAGQSSFAPGQVVAMPPQAWSPATPHSSQPFFNPMGESPIGSPVSPAPYDSAYNAQGQLIRSPSAGAGAFLERHGSNGAEMMLNRQPSPGPNVMLNRQPSSGPNVMLNRQPSGHSPYLTRQSPSAAMQVDAPPEAYYVDLNRSSVSPFQAAQYAEISNRLQAEPPAPLPTPLVAAAAEQVFMKEDQVTYAATTPRPLNVTTGRVGSPVHANGPSPFADPMEQHAMDFDDLPKPPSPTYSSKSRIDSTPPMLPEISLQQRSFSPVTMEFPISPPAHPKPSPLSLAAPNTPSEIIFDAPLTPRPAKDTPSTPRPDTTYTVYDEEDAYGGF